MFDIGISKLAIVGAIALVVIGPERLPGVVRTLGTLFGRARRYVAEVQTEVKRSMDLDELKRMQAEVSNAARDVETSLRTGVADFEQHLTTAATAEPEIYPQYRHPDKHWRRKRAAMPQWYKMRNRVRTKALSGAARVARFRPPRRY